MATLFESYLDKAKERKFEKGVTYTLDGKQVEYLGTQRERPEIKANATDGDALLDKPVLLFKWKEGDASISSYGVKGDIIKLGLKTARKRVK